MGQLIPLFGKNRPAPPTHNIPTEQGTRLKMALNSLEGFRREEKALQAEILKKCPYEIDRLNVLEQQIRQLESEVSRLNQPSSGNLPA